MKNRVFFVVILLAGLSLACGFNVSTANIAGAKMATDPDGNNPTTVFSPEDVFYAVVDLANAPDDTTVKATWVVVKAEGVDENMTVDEAELTSGSGTLQFDLTNDNPWPAGKYRVDLYLNDELDRSLDFEVEGQPVAAEPDPTNTPQPEPTATPQPEPTATPKKSAGDSLGGKSSEQAEGDSLAGQPKTAEPLPLQAEPYVHPSGAFTFAVPEGWEPYNEDDLSAAFGDDQSRQGAVFVNVGADQMDEAETLDFINGSLDIIVKTFADDYEILGENNKLADSGIYFVAISFSDGDGRAEFFFEPRDSVMFIFYFTSLNYNEMEPTWNAIIDSYGFDVEAAQLADPAPTPTPLPTPKPKPKPAANPYKPPAGVARVFLQNKYPNEYNIDFGDGSGSIKVLPNAQNFYHDVPPGKYNPGLSLPGGGAANVEFEIKGDEAYVILVDENSRVKMGKVYPR